MRSFLRDRSLVGLRVAPLEYGKGARGSEFAAFVAEGFVGRSVEPCFSRGEGASWGDPRFVADPSEFLGGFSVGLSVMRRKYFGVGDNFVRESAIDGVSPAGEDAYYENERST